MRRLKFIIFSLYIFNFWGSFARTADLTTLIFKPFFGTEELLLNNRWYKIGVSDSILFSQLKFYVSNVRLAVNDGDLDREPNYHLVDLEKKESMKILVENRDDLYWNKVKFNLGVDSATNVAGAMGFDLDPTNGMYWTWQSGYINLKLEGKCSLCPTRKNEFIFHLGGYQSPFNSMHEIELVASPKEVIEIKMDFAKLFQQINLKEQNALMSPGKEAARMSLLVAQLFTVAN